MEFLSKPFLIDFFLGLRLILFIYVSNFLYGLLAVGCMGEFVADNEMHERFEKLCEMIVKMML